MVVFGLTATDPDLIGILRVPSSEHLKTGVTGAEEVKVFEVELLQEGAGDINTAEGGGVRALTGVRDRLNRIRSAVLDRYSPFTLLKCYFEFSVIAKISNFKG